MEIQCRTLNNVGNGKMMRRYQGAQLLQWIAKAATELLDHTK